MHAPRRRQIFAAQLNPSRIFLNASQPIFFGAKVSIIYPPFLNYVHIDFGVDSPVITRTQKPQGQRHRQATMQGLHANGM